jgi:hypothetical protein
MWSAHSFVLCSKVEMKCQTTSTSILSVEFKFDTFLKNHCFINTTVKTSNQSFLLYAKPVPYNFYCRYFWYIQINSLKLHQLATACLTVINSLRTAELIFIKLDSGEFHTNFLTYCTKHACFCAHRSVNFWNIYQCQSVLNICPMHFFCKFYSFQSIGRTFCNVFNRTFI